MSRAIMDQSMYGLVHSPWINQTAQSCLYPIHRRSVVNISKLTALLAMIINQWLLSTYFSTFHEESGRHSEMVETNPGRSLTYYRNSVAAVSDAEKYVNR